MPPKGEGGSPLSSAVFSFILASLPPHFDPPEHLRSCPLPSLSLPQPSSHTRTNVGCAPFARNPSNSACPPPSGPNNTETRPDTCAPPLAGWPPSLPPSLPSSIQTSSPRRVSALRLRCCSRAPHTRRPPGACLPRAPQKNRGHRSPVILESPHVLAGSPGAGGKRDTTIQEIPASRVS